MLLKKADDKEINIFLAKINKDYISTRQNFHKISKHSIYYRSQIFGPDE